MIGKPLHLKSEDQESAFCPGSYSGIARVLYVLEFIAGGIGALGAMIPHRGGFRLESPGAGPHSEQSHQISGVGPRTQWCLEAPCDPSDLPGLKSLAPAATWAGDGNSQAGVQTLGAHTVQGLRASEPCPLAPRSQASSLFSLCLSFLIHKLGVRAYLSPRA